MQAIAEMQFVTSGFWKHDEDVVAGANVARPFGGYLDHFALHGRLTIEASGARAFVHRRQAHPGVRSAD